MESSNNDSFEIVPELNAVPLTFIDKDLMSQKADTSKVKVSPQCFPAEVSHLLSNQRGDRRAPISPSDPFAKAIGRTRCSPEYLQITGNDEIATAFLCAGGYLLTSGQVGDARVQDASGDWFYGLSYIEFDVPKSDGNGKLSPLNPFSQNTFPVIRKFINPRDGRPDETDPDNPFTRYNPKLPVIQENWCVFKVGPNKKGENVFEKQLYTFRLSDEYDFTQLSLSRSVTISGYGFYSNIKLNNHTLQTQTGPVEFEYRMPYSNYLYSDITISRGNSGSPIYFENGLVVGLCTEFLPKEELAFGIGMKTIALISAMNSRMDSDYIVDPLHKTQKYRDGSIFSPFKTLKETIKNVGRDAIIGFVGSIVYDYEGPFNFWEYSKNRISLKALGSEASFYP